ncbi:hypothetical protein B0T16DRAFT_71656 [Cercophora newfieldiana]|uniref:Uncharacterized protein n=1 Tax=Cercophora newfieldiana TaxID=92897 RepID=A0AA39YV31_9PEZI|nr:hypothetical protein B0T16DRAFT_71656 [Cercophora newfieldiana]
MTVVFWGSYHAQAQLLVSLRRWTTYSLRRFIICLGLLLPSASSVVASVHLSLWKDSAKEWFTKGGLNLHHLEGEIVDIIPVLYWRGIESDDRCLALIFWSGFLWLLAMSTVVLWRVWTFFGPLLMPVLRDFSRCREWLYRQFTSLPDFGQVNTSVRKLYTGMVVVSALTLGGGLLCLLLYYLFACIFTASSGVLVYPVFVSVFLIKRLCGSIKDSDCCFLMPCAPQSISETDQAAALFIGLFLFVGVEIAMPLYKRVKLGHGVKAEFKPLRNSQSGGRQG